MESLVERRKTLSGIISNYINLLNAQKGEEYHERNQRLLDFLKEIERDRYEIALIGHVKRGKSTIINALLGDQDNYNISPVDSLTCTGAIIKYMDKKLFPGEEKKEGAIVYYNDEREPEYISETEDYTKYINQTVKGFDKNEVKKIDHIEIYGAFPLIETRGIFIDTPGLGAVNDQDYLAENILSRVDIILCPQAADNLLSGEEQKFLMDLKPEVKNKLVFILTKIDEMDYDQKRIASSVEKIEKAAKNSIGKKPDKVFTIAAKEVLKAYAANKSQEEVNIIKKECGIDELQNYIDSTLRKTSNAEKILKGKLRILLEDVNIDEANWKDTSEKTKLTEVQLQQEKKKLEEYCNTLKDEYDKNIENFRENWKKTIRLFIKNLKRKETDISNDLLRNKAKSIFELINYKKRMNRKIMSQIEETLSSELKELKDDLDNHIKILTKKLNEGIDSVSFDNDYFSKSGLKNEIGVLIGTAAAGGTGLYISAGAVTHISASGMAWAQAATTAAQLTAHAEGVAKTAGAISHIGGFVAGKGKVAKAAAEAAAATAAAEGAKGVFFMELLGGIVPLIGSFAISFIAMAIGKAIVNNKQETDIPSLVKDKLEESATNIENDTNDMFEDVLEKFEKHWNYILKKPQESLDNVIKNIQKNNSEEVLKNIKDNLEKLNSIKSEIIKLKNIMEN